MRHDLDFRIQIADSFPRRFEFRASDVRRPVKNLAVEIRDVDVVEIDEANAPDAGRGEIRRGGTAEPSRADDEDGRRAQPGLPLDADLRQRDLARVAVQGSSRDTISCSFFPSARPLYFADASFMTLPMSFLDCAPVEATISRMPLSSSSSVSSGGR